MNQKLLLLCVLSFSIVFLHGQNTPFEEVTQKIPGKIEAEYYDEGGEGIAYHDDGMKNGEQTFRPNDMVDIDLRAHGRSLGWIKAGEWLLYTVDVKYDGEYKLLGNFNVQSPDGTGKLLLKINGDSIGTYTINGMANDILTYKVEILDTLILTPGIKTLRLEFTEAVKLNFDYLEFVPIDIGQAPYLGVLQTIPGKIEAEYYDWGGEGISYHDVDNVKNGNKSYRPTDLIDFAHIGSGTIIGWIQGGEWMEYTVNVKYTGEYKLSAYLNILEDKGGKIRLKYGSDSADYTGTVAGDWVTFTLDVLDTLTLSAGVQVLRVEFIGNVRINFDYLELTPVSLGVDQLPFNYSAQTIPGRIEAENYDEGGEGIAYHDDTLRSPGTAVWRPDEFVDVEGNHIRRFIGGIDAGEWVEYTVNVERSKEFILLANTSGNTEGGGIVLRINGDSVNNYAISASGGPDVFKVDTLDTLMLNRGEHIIRLEFPDKIPINLDYLHFVNPYISSKAGLALIKVGDSVIPGFREDSLNYDVELAIGTKIIPDIVAIPIAPSTLDINDVITSFPGKVIITVTSEDGFTEKLYFINLTVAKDTIASLITIKIDGDDIREFTSDKYVYEYELDSDTVPYPKLEYTTTGYFATAKHSAPSSPTPPGSIDITVTAEDSTTQKVYTINFTVAVPDNTNSLNELNARSFKLYPLPVIGEMLYIESKEPILGVKIHNITGGIAQLNNNITAASRQTINLSGVKRGVYLISVTTRIGTTSQKFIIK